MTKTLDELMAMVGNSFGNRYETLKLESALRELIADRDLLKDALWKACGDDEQMVNDYIESQRPTHQG